ncbi:MAG TPA: MBL fold metallo-hydrolase [Candidatus Dormibacteraeota bacterium]|nr:MBL fold metallo-hydrolase [Candidatus Dormibacteraeota bacterium]
MSVSVRFLGTGDAFNARGRCHASYLVTAPSATLLLDCGASALLAMQRDGVDITRLDAICLSHLHGDHFAGLPFLFIAATFDVPRRRPLTILGPPGTEARVRDLYRAMYRDLAVKPLPFEIRYIEVAGGVRTAMGAAELLSFEVPHQLTELSLGYRLTVDGKVVLYSGDTGWTETLVTQSRGADLFICECCFYETRVDFHIDYPRLAAERHRLGCERLVLSHCGREVLAHRDEIDEVIASDGLVVEI